MQPRDDDRVFWGSVVQYLTLIQIQVNVINVRRGGTYFHLGLRERESKQQAMNEEWSQHSIGIPNPTSVQVTNANPSSAQHNVH